MHETALKLPPILSKKKNINFWGSLPVLPHIFARMPLNCHLYVQATGPNIFKYLIGWGQGQFRVFGHIPLYIHYVPVSVWLRELWTQWCWWSAKFWRPRLSIRRQHPPCSLARMTGARSQSAAAVKSVIIWKSVAICAPTQKKGHNDEPEEQQHT